MRSSSFLIYKIYNDTKSGFRRYFLSSIKYLKYLKYEAITYKFIFIG